MLYSELLKRQEEEASRLNFEYRESRDQIKEMQQGHYDPDKYKEDIQRLDAAFKRDCQTLDKRHRSEKKEFLNEPEQDTTRQRDMDNAYDKTVTVTMTNLHPKAKESSVDQKMREWEESQKEKAQQRNRTQER